MLALALALVALLPALSSAATCVQFDANKELYAFGGEQDVALGTAETWATPNARPLQAEGRPPYTGKNMQCFLSQNANALYVYGADESDQSAIYIYDFAGDAWSKQETAGAPPSISNSRSSAILDHNTNVIFTLTADGVCWQADMSSIKNVAGGSVPWEQVRTPAWWKDGYKVTAAQAANHINYFGVPGTPDATAQVFVVHYAHFQNETQLYPTQNNGVSFPSSAGQAVSFMSPDDQAPFQMLFVPDDFSQSYVVTHWTNPADYANSTGSPMGPALINSTQLLPPPAAQDKDAAYAASVSDVVQINNRGEIHYIAGAVDNYGVNDGAQWAKLAYEYKVGEAAVQKAENDSKADASSAAAVASKTAAANASAAPSEPAASDSSAAPGLGAGAGLTLAALAAGLAALL